MYDPAQEFSVADPFVDLWYVRLEKIDAAIEAECLTILSNAERARLARFTHKPSRQQSLVSRALMRVALAHYLGSDPRNLQFQHNAYGKPALSNMPSGLEFNLSHTRGLVICGVTRGHAIGVDVESYYRRAAHQDLAQRYFATPEIAMLQRYPVAEQSKVFIKLWTLKEAFIKARGLGLSLPLDSFAFDLAPGQSPQIALLAKAEGVSRDWQPTSGWQFAQIDFAGQYCIALAIERSAAIPLTIQLREIIPLHKRKAVQLLEPCGDSRWNIF